MNRQSVGCVSGTAFTNRVYASGTVGAIMTSPPPSSHAATATSSAPKQANAKLPRIHVECSSLIALEESHVHGEKRNTGTSEEPGGSGGSRSSPRSNPPLIARDAMNAPMAPATAPAASAVFPRESRRTPRCRRSFGSPAPIRPTSGWYPCLPERSETGSSRSRCYRCVSRALPSEQCRGRVGRRGRHAPDR